MSPVAERLAAIRARVQAAARRAGREPASVRLIAVSKQQPEAKIREAHAAGQRDFGESYAQELAAKAQALSDLPDLQWHFIGHLQSNKAKLVAPVVSWLHSLDSPRLAEELGKRRGGEALRCLVEVNIGREPQKHGVAPAQVGEVAEALLALPGVSLQGLMALPPAGDAAGGHFAALRRLRDELSARLGRPLPELSMGMSDDFEAAIAEGATFVRVGTAIFGARTG